MAYHLILFDTLGGQEERLQKRLQLSGEADADSEQRSTVHSLVTTFRRGKQRIRVEVIASSENFLNVSKVAIKRVMICIFMYLQLFYFLNHIDSAK